MIWALEWSFVAERRDLLEIPPDAAGRLCSALMQLAETGRGDLVRIEAGDPNRFRLRVRGAEAQLFLHVRARTIHVVRVYRRR